MKYLNWETANLPRHAKMSHKLRSMMKMRNRRTFNLKPMDSQTKGGTK